MRFIACATEEIAQHLHPGMVVVLESTTSPGTTREVVAPRLAAAGGKIGEDLFIAFSPETRRPGNQKWKTRNTPKVIGGVTKQCCEVAKTLIEQAIGGGGLDHLPALRRRASCNMTATSLARPYVHERGQCSREASLGASVLR